MKRKPIKTCGTSVMDKYINNFLKPFGLTAYYGETFRYYDREKTVRYTAYTYPEDEALIDYLHDTYNIDVQCYYFIFSLLHEVGHHMTFGKFSEEDRNFDSFCRNILIPNMATKEDRQLAYFNLPMEQAATKWALWYILEHFDECWELQMRVFEVMKHTLKKKSFKKRRK